MFVSIIKYLSVMRVIAMHVYPLMYTVFEFKTHLTCTLFACSAALCPNPVDIDNGMVTFTGNSVSDTATYTCDSGFELIGSATTTCIEVDMNSAAFQPVPPSCSREYTDYTLKMAIYQVSGGWVNHTLQKEKGRFNPARVISVASSLPNNVHIPADQLHC